MAKTSYHVIPALDGGWSVSKTGALRATKHFDKKTEAVDWGRDISQQHGTELYIHSFDGTVETKLTFGRETALEGAK